MKILKISAWQLGISHTAVKADCCCGNETDLGSCQALKSRVISFVKFFENLSNHRNLKANKHIKIFICQGLIFLNRFFYFLFLN